MIDIHNHILPGVDDGARDMEQSRKMLKIAYTEGIRSIIATPHYVIGNKNKDVSYLEEIRQQVQQEALALDMDIKIYLGNELYYSEDIIEDLQKGKALTLAGTRYVLVEFLPSIQFRQIEIAIHNLVLNGYVPIIAHVERYICLVEAHERIDELIQEGAYIQINISSLLGGIANKRAFFCKKLIKEDMVHFIGTDAHNDDYRPPNMAKGIHVITKKYGTETAEILVLKNPGLLLENKYL